MKKCDCEHWETCMICYPQGFDGQGNRKPVEVPPTREELQAKVAELEKSLSDATYIHETLGDTITRAEAVIEKCNLALELNVPLLTTRLAAIFAIAAYREGK